MLPANVFEQHTNSTMRQAVTASWHMQAGLASCFTLLAKLIGGITQALLMAAKLMCAIWSNLLPGTCVYHPYTIVPISCRAALFCVPVDRQASGALATMCKHYMMHASCGTRALASSGVAYQQHPLLQALASSIMLSHCCCVMAAAHCACMAAPPRQALLVRAGASTCSEEQPQLHAGAV